MFKAERNDLGRSSTLLAMLNKLIKQFSCELHGYGINGVSFLC